MHLWEKGANPPVCAFFLRLPQQKRRPPASSLEWTTGKDFSRETPLPALFRLLQIRSNSLAAPLFGNVNIRTVEAAVVIHPKGEPVEFFRSQFHAVMIRFENFIKTASAGAEIHRLGSRLIPQIVVIVETVFNQVRKRI